MRRLASTLIAWGPLGLFLLAVIDSAGIPVPGGVDALVVFLAAADSSHAWRAALVAVAGSAIGCMFLFYVARKGGELYLERQTLSPRARRFRNWFLDYGLLTVFIPALVPIPLPVKVFVISAGALGVRPVSFLIVVLLARVPRYLGLAYLGTKLGAESYKQWLGDHAWHLAGGALGLFLFLLLLVKVTGRLRSKSLTN